MNNKINKFSTWLLDEMIQRDWSQANLARRSGVSKGMISLMINENQIPGPGICAKLAKAFKISPETVLRQAGHLPPLYDDPDTMAEWVHLYRIAEKQDREYLLEIARALARRSKK